MLRNKFVGRNVLWAARSGQAWLRQVWLRNIGRFVARAGRAGFNGRITVHSIHLEARSRMAMPGKGMQPRPDGLRVAPSELPSPAVLVDISDDLEIGRCKAGLRLLVAAGFVMTLASGSLAFGWFDGIVDYDKEAGYAGVVLFGALTCWLIWMLPIGRGPVVVVTPFGIRDLRLGNEFLVWESIAEVSAGEKRGRRVIMLKPTPALLRQLSCMRAAAHGARMDCIVIDPDGLSIDFDTLLRACRACHAASRAGHASLHEHERDARGFAVPAS